MDQSSDNRESANSFFVGVPSPAGAGIMLIPIVITLVGNRLGIPTKIDNTVMVLIATVWIAVVSILLISNIRTISFKKFRFKIRKKSATLILVFTILIITTLIKEFWVTIFVLQAVYVISLPICGLILKGEKVTD